MNKEVKYLGIDIGGAHLKLVGLDAKKEIIHVSYLQCPIWESLDNLTYHLNKLKKAVSIKSVFCCITMSAELCDLFKNRSLGVRKISSICKKTGLKFFFFSNKKGCFTKKFCPDSISSMNWLAPAVFLKNILENAILLDLGSTTTDITIIKDSNIINRGFNDFDRLKNHELVYTGIVRTPIFSFSNRLSIGKNHLDIIPEFFSNMADIYRINNSLPKDSDLLPSMDKRNKSLINSLRRVSRNFGFDYKPSQEELLKSISKKLIDLQLKFIFESMHTQLKQKEISKKLPIIACGIGKELILKYGRKHNYEIKCFSNFLCGNNQLILDAANHAPATACALLLYELNN